MLASYDRGVPKEGWAELPIFELPLALVPSERVPLHIFEPRYRAMIASCREHDAPFGIVLTDEEGARSVGCTVLVEQVAKTYPDGGMDIIARGQEVFRVLDRFQAREWPAARAEPVATGQPGGGSGAELAEARAAFAKLLEAVGADADRASEADSAFAIAAQIELPGERKQRHLEAEDEERRLAILSALIRELLAELTRKREMVRRAASNGRGRVRPRDP